MKTDSWVPQKSPWWQFPTCFPHFRIRFFMLHLLFPQFLRGYFPCFPRCFSLLPILGLVYGDLLHCRENMIGQNFCDGRWRIFWKISDQFFNLVTSENGRVLSNIQVLAGLQIDTAIYVEVGNEWMNKLIYSLVGHSLVKKLS